MENEGKTKGLQEESTTVQELVAKIHAGNILGFLGEVTGRLMDEDHAKAEKIVQSYILRYFSDSATVNVKKETV